jgi:hypothetical protein
LTATGSLEAICQARIKVPTREKRGRDLSCHRARPGRVLIASRSATFEQLATAIDDAIARWNRNHLHEFTLTDGTVITPHRWWDGEEPDRSLDGAKTRLGRLRLSEQFAYVFDLGDNWQHLCTVAPQRADPLETLGIIPVGPLPC